MTLLRCRTEEHGGDRLFYDGSVLVLVREASGQIIDYRLGLRYAPPFAQVLPCPFCGVEEDRNHGEGHVESWKRARPE